MCILYTVYTYARLEQSYNTVSVVLNRGKLLVTDHSVDLQLPTRAGPAHMQANIVDYEYLCRAQHVNTSMHRYMTYRLFDVYGLSTTKLGYSWFKGKNLAIHGLLYGDPLAIRE